VIRGLGKGKLVLSNAERQARYRARLKAHQPTPVIRYRRPKDKRSRAQRWDDAVTELLALQAEYTAWHQPCPTPSPALRRRLDGFASVAAIAARRDDGGVKLSKSGWPKSRHGTSCITSHS
jgi:hypothetical protein